MKIRTGNVSNIMGFFEISVFETARADCIGKPVNTINHRQTSYNHVLSLPAVKIGTKSHTIF